MEKMYEIVLKGGMECGYVYSEQTIGLFPTLDDAKAFLESNPRIYCWLEAWDKFVVFERKIGVQYEEDESPVYETDSVDWIGFDGFDEGQNHGKWYWRVFDMLEDESHIDWWKIHDMYCDSGESFAETARKLLARKNDND